MYLLVLYFGRLRVHTCFYMLVLGISLLFPFRSVCFSKVPTL